MRNLVVLSIALAASAACMAQETGRVISSTPVIQQVPVSHPVCNNPPVEVPQRTSGAGAVLGAVAGGAMGNAVGGGGGRAAATMLGLVGGALLGDRVEGGGNAQVQNVPQCATQTHYENRIVAYNVVYEYAGRQYTVQMSNDPGPSIALQVTPVGAVDAQTQSATQGLVSAQPVVLAPTTVIQAAPAVVYPYAPPVSLNFGLGWGWGFGGRGHWH